jgi:plastocyanin
MRASTLAWLAVAAVFALGACGGDDDKSVDEQKAVSPSGRAAATVRVSETDFELQPANPRIAKSGLVRFDLRNDGKVEHSLEVEGPGGESKLEPTLAPGESGSLKVRLEPGTYEWYCPVGNHKALGMRGEITVGRPSGTPTTGGDSPSGDDSSSGGSGSGY